MLWLVVIVGLGACHTMRVVPPVSSALPEAFAPVKTSVIKVQGYVYGPRDTTTFVPGVELVFSIPRADSAAQLWRDVTKPDGSYQVILPAGATYQIALNKDGVNIERQEFAVPEERADTGRVAKNFYLNYDERDYSYDRWPSIYFNATRADLRPGPMATLDTIAVILQAEPRLRLSVEGHVDEMEVPRGQPNRQQYILQLGRQRAKAACAYLQKKGASASCLLIVSYGSKRPAAPSDTPTHRQFNRRVEFKAIEVEGLNSHYGELKKNSLK